LNCSKDLQLRRLRLPKLRRLLPSWFGGEEHEVSALVEDALYRLTRSLSVMGVTASNFS